MRVPEGDKKEKEAERIFEEILAGIFPNLMIDKNVNILEAQQTPNRMNSRRPTLRHIVIKLSKTKKEF